MGQHKQPSGQILSSRKFPGEWAATCKSPESNLGMADTSSETRGKAGVTRAFTKQAHSSFHSGPPNLPTVYHPGARNHLRSLPGKPHTAGQ